MDDRSMDDVFIFGVVFVVVGTGAPFEE